MKLNYIYFVAKKGSGNKVIRSVPRPPKLTIPDLMLSVRSRDLSLITSYLAKAKMGKELITNNRPFLFITLEIYPVSFFIDVITSPAILLRDFNWNNKKHVYF